ncbi:hypothetical protein D3C87_1148260 [compost metagenome]|jgi:hypothetical protein
MLVNEGDLLRFHRARWILIGTTAAFISVYSVLFIASAGIIYNFAAMLVYAAWMFGWVFRKYRCPRCNSIPRLKGFKPIDLAPKICWKCGLNFYKAESHCKD